MSSKPSTDTMISALHQFNPTGPWDIVATHPDNIKERVEKTFYDLYSVRLFIDQHLGIWKVWVPIPGTGEGDARLWVMA